MTDGLICAQPKEKYSGQSERAWNPDENGHLVEELNQIKQVLDLSN